MIDMASELKAKSGRRLRLVFISKIEEVCLISVHSSRVIQLYDICLLNLSIDKVSVGGLHPIG